MAIGTSVIMRIEMDKTKVGFGQVISEIANAGGDVVAIDVIRASKETTIRDITVNVPDADNGRLAEAVSALEGAMGIQRDQWGVEAPSYRGDEVERSGDPSWGLVLSELAAGDAITENLLGQGVAGSTDIVGRLTRVPMTVRPSGAASASVAEVPRVADDGAGDDDGGSVAAGEPAGDGQVPSGAGVVVAPELQPVADPLQDVFPGGRPVPPVELPGVNQPVGDPVDPREFDPNRGRDAAAPDPEPAPWDVPGFPGRDQQLEDALGVPGLFTSPLGREEVVVEGRPAAGEPVAEPVPAPQPGGASVGEPVVVGVSPSVGAGVTSSAPPRGSIVREYWQDSTQPDGLPGSRLVIETSDATYVSAPGGYQVYGLDGRPMQPGAAAVSSAAEPVAGRQITPARNLSSADLQSVPGSFDAAPYEEPIFTGVSSSPALVQPAPRQAPQQAAVQQAPVGYAALPSGGQGVVFEEPQQLSGTGNPRDTAGVVTVVQDPQTGQRFASVQPTRVANPDGTETVFIPQLSRQRVGYNPTGNTAAVYQLGEGQTGRVTASTPVNQVRVRTSSATPLRFNGGGGANSLPGTAYRDPTTDPTMEEWTIFPASTINYDTGVRTYSAQLPAGYENQVDLAQGGVIRLRVPAGTRPSAPVTQAEQAFTPYVPTPMPTYSAPASTYTPAPTYTAPAPQRTTPRRTTPQPSVSQRTTHRPSTPATQPQQGGVGQFLNQAGQVAQGVVNNQPLTVRDLPNDRVEVTFMDRRVGVYDFRTGNRVSGAGPNWILPLQLATPGRAAGEFMEGAGRLIEGAGQLIQNLPPIIPIPGMDPSRRLGF